MQSAWRSKLADGGADDEDRVCAPQEGSRAVRGRGEDDLDGGGFDGADIRDGICCEHKLEVDVSGGRGGPIGARFRQEVGDGGRVETQREQASRLLLDIEGAGGQRARFLVGVDGSGEDGGGGDPDGKEGAGDEDLDKRVGAPASGAGGVDGAKSGRFGMLPPQGRNALHPRPGAASGSCRTCPGLWDEAPWGLGFMPLWAGFIRAGFRSTRSGRCRGRGCRGRCCVRG